MIIVHYPVVLREVNCVSILLTVRYLDIDGNQVQNGWPLACNRQQRERIFLQIASIYDLAIEG